MTTLSSTIKIALDAMGGDHGSDVVIAAANSALASNDKLTLILVGIPAELDHKLERNPYLQQGRLRVYPASEVVGMDESPSSALRGKKDSSMRVAINLVKQGEADACVSAGNTGALMATARFVLKTLPGIDRPAICTALPTRQGQVHMLDLGANVDSEAEHLLQFAIMGSVLVTAISGKASPRVGLLNIGAEEIKGNEQVKAAALLLSQSDLNYIGFVEGDDIFLKDIDVVVCDGFVGNVALKTIEGTSKLIKHLMELEFKRNILTKILTLFALPVLRGLKQRIDPRKYNGASLLGLNGIVVKSHGNADAVSFANAIGIAAIAVEQQVPQHIREQLKVREQLAINGSEAV